MITIRQLRKQQKWWGLASLAALVALFALGGCTDEVGATKAIKDAGLKPVKVGGYAAFSCDSKSDIFSTKFTATNINGQTVTGAVCSGWIKGKTVRFD